MKKISPNIQDIKGEENTIADAICILNRSDPDSEDEVSIEEVSIITEDIDDLLLELKNHCCWESIIQL